MKLRRSTKQFEDCLEVQAGAGIIDRDLSFPKVVLRHSRPRSTGTTRQRFEEGVAALMGFREKAEEFFFLGNIELDNGVHRVQQPPCLRKFIVAGLDRRMFRETFEPAD